MVHEGTPVNYTFTVGKLDAGIAILIGERASLIEFPALLLPHGVQVGSVVDIRVTRNDAEEQQQREAFVALQDDILQMYGINSPAPPALRLRNVTQTTLTLEWDPLQLANADLHSLDIVRNGQRIAKVPRPLHTTSTKLSGLAMDTDYTIQLVLYTSAGTFASDELRTRTHTIQDTSGIHVCFGAIDDARLRAAAEDVLAGLGGQWSEQIQVDTTHLVTTHAPRGQADTPDARVYAKAQQLSIPIVQPHWLFACADEHRMVNISSYYVDVMAPNAVQVKERLAKQAPRPAPAEAPKAPEAPEAPVSAAASTGATVEATIASSEAPGEPAAPAASADDTLESEMENIAL
ncbi:Chitin synthase, class 5 [Malassezia brasiliensis]|uniref:Chitin synthase, class 5 n=1 Tax=Malassezia brasiliensis TaxID=1821822 RepID=A0AAF0DWU0_9BASI|nr:Chitin synthase, class 5 [Malassezia brasiliensis]